MGGIGIRLLAIIVGSLIPSSLLGGPAAASDPVSTAPFGQRNALIEAAKRGDLATVRSELAGPDGESALLSPDGLGRTALHYAARLGHPDIVRALLAAGAAPDARDAAGYTPLLRAVQGGDENAAVVALLLEAGADPDAEAEGRDAISLAETVGAARVKELIEQSFDN